MPTSSGVQVARSIRQKMEELKRVCEGLDDAAASPRPRRPMVPKEILSHFCGPEGSAHLRLFQAFLKETPIIDIHPGDPFFTQHPAG